MSSTKKKTQKTNKTPRLHPIARVVLCGVYDKDNVWYCLGGMRYIVKKILDQVFEYNKKYKNILFLTNI